MRIGYNDPRVVADGCPLRLRGIPVINSRLRGDARKPGHLFKRCKLIIREGLCRIQVQSSCGGIGFQFLKNRQIERQRFATRGRCGNDDIPTGTDVIDRLALMGIQPDIFTIEICFKRGREGLS